MVVDAGGGTVDISSYVINSTNPLGVEELAAPGCEYISLTHPHIAFLSISAGIMQGSTVVNMRAESFFRSMCLRLIEANCYHNADMSHIIERLQPNSDLSNNDTIRTMMDNFDKTVKPLFTDASTRGCFLNTGLTLNDAALNVKRGNLCLSRYAWACSYFRQ